MTDLTGKFFWYELMTSDPEGAIRFYGDVVGGPPRLSAMTCKAIPIM